MVITERFLILVGQALPGYRLARAVRYSAVVHLWGPALGGVCVSMCGRTGGELLGRGENLVGYLMCQKCEPALTRVGVISPAGLVEV